MPRAGFEPANPATKRPQTYALDRAATGIGTSHLYFVPNHSTCDWYRPAPLIIVKYTLQWQILIPLETRMYVTVVLWYIALCWVSPSSRSPIKYVMIYNIRLTILNTIRSECVTLESWSFPIYFRWILQNYCAVPPIAFTPPFSLLRYRISFHVNNSDGKFCASVRTDRHSKVCPFTDPHSVPFHIQYI
jgi:hypothetical protein